MVLLFAWRCLGFKTSLTSKTADDEVPSEAWLISFVCAIVFFNINVSLLPGQPYEPLREEVQQEIAAIEVEIFSPALSESEPDLKSEVEEQALSGLEAELEAQVLSSELQDIETELEVEMLSPALEGLEPEVEVHIEVHSPALEVLEPEREVHIEPEPELELEPEFEEQVEVLAGLEPELEEKVLFSSALQDIEPELEVVTLSPGVSSPEVKPEVKVEVLSDASQVDNWLTISLPTLIAGILVVRAWRSLHNARSRRTAVPDTLSLDGHEGAQSKHMGLYSLNGKYNGYAKFSGPSGVLYRAGNVDHDEGRWMVAPNEDERLMAGNHCVIRTKSKAKLPIHEGVQWQYLDSGWNDDLALSCSEVGERQWRNVMPIALPNSCPQHAYPLSSTIPQAAHQPSLTRLPLARPPPAPRVSAPAQRHSQAPPIYRSRV